MDPMQSRLEKLCIATFVISPVLLGSIAIVTLLYLLIAGNICWKILFALYLLFYFYDIGCGDRGGRGAGNPRENSSYERSIYYEIFFSTNRHIDALSTNKSTIFSVAWIRDLIFWKYFRNYFPIDLVKTVDLSPDRNYLVCVFPHGVLSFGVAGNFCTSHSKWSTLFPGLRPKVATLSLNALVPLARELILSVGCCSASEASLTTLLKQSNDATHKSNCDGFTSNAVALLVGGIREQRQCTYPNRYRFVLKNRKGFVRIALTAGASLVPAISFGENDCYDITESKTGWFKGIFKKVENRFYFGRGYFQYSFGILPKRRPITTVIGAPIHLKKIPIPSQEEINEAHELFCTRIDNLFEEHKSKYVKNFEHVRVEFV